MMQSRWLRFALLMVVLAALGLALWKYWPDIRALPRISPWVMLVVAVLYLAVRWLNGLTTRAALAAMGYSMSYWEAFMLAVLTTYGNLLVPRAGLGVPALYLRTQRGVGYAEFTVQSIVVTVLQTAGLGVAGLTCLGILAGVYGRPVDSLVLALFIGAIVLGIGATQIPRNLGKGSENKLAKLAHRIAIAWATVGSSRRTIVVLFLLDLPMLALRALRLWIVFWALGYPVNYFAVFIASGLADLSFLVSVTPAGLGFREAAITYAATMLGVPPPVALSASIADRLIWTAAVITVAQVGMWTMIRPALRSTPTEV